MAPDAGGGPVAQAGSPGQLKGKVFRHSRMATRTLKGWLATHSAYPYPTIEEKEVLAEKSGLTASQVSHWFVNARRRGKVVPVAPTVTVHAPEEMLGPSLPDLGLLDHGEWHNMTPLDRWQNSPPDQEAASLTAITEAVESSTYAVSAPSFGSHGFCAGQWPVETHSEPSSLGSFDFAWSSQESSSSAFSHTSESAVAVHGRHGRRRRRRHGRSYAAIARCGGQPSPTKPSREDSAKRIFQCTFCTDTFKTKHDWMRHEGTVHLTLEQWTCLPFGARYCDATELQLRCSLCGAADPSDAHLDSHKSRECVAKPLATRTFHRKDHLRQHLRASHGVAEILPLMEAWKSKIARVNSRCGFCGQSFTVWSERNDHLADHFHDGAHMKDWKGCRGLDAAMALLVENAMPPYLIGTEANDMEPFSASRLVAQGGMPSQEAGYLATPTQFETVTARLSDYVRASRLSGIRVTDDLLRREARMILYGDDDPWNQTPADNNEWLRLFKKGHGLLALANVAVSSRDVTAPVACPQGPSLDPLSDADLGPFSVAKMQQAGLLGSDPGSLASCCASQTIPWSWQTPECLAEFSEMREGAPLSVPWEAEEPFFCDLDVSTMFQPSCQMP